MPIVTALNVVADVVGNKYIGKQVSGHGRRCFSRGVLVSNSPAQRDLFTAGAANDRSRGRKWQPAGLLDEVSDFYDGEVEYDLSRLTASIEPILIMFIAVLVLILALGVFLPIWDLGAAAR